MLKHSGSWQQNKPLRFLVAGLCNTLFAFAVYALLLFSGLALWLSLLLGTIAGTLFNYFTFGRYVFRQFSWKIFWSFLSCYGFLYVINFVLLKLLRSAMGGDLATQLVLTVPMAVLSYLLLKRFVFVAGEPPHNRVL